MKRTSKICIAVCTSLVIGGCANHPVNSDRFISEDHMDGTANPAEGYATYLDAKRQINSPDPDKETLKRFVEQGSMLTYQNCLSTVEGIANNSHQMSYTKDQYLVGSVLATGLLAINGASTETIERLALGSSFLVSSLELYQNYYLMGPDAASVVDLVRKAMNKQLDYALEQSPHTFYKAAKIILDLSYVCSSVQINQMVADSIRTANIKSPSEVLPQLLVQEQLETILDEKIISNIEMAAMYELMSVGQSGLEEGWTSAVLKRIKDKVKDNFNKIRKLLTIQPQSFKQQVEDHIDSMTGGNDPEPVSIDAQKRIESLTESLAARLEESVDSNHIYLTYDVFKYLEGSDKTIADFLAELPDRFDGLNEEAITFLKKNTTALESWYKTLDDIDIAVLEAAPAPGEELEIMLEKPVAKPFTLKSFDYTPTQTDRSIVTIERE
ncbi:hypothetical protein MHN00_20375 [Alteromonas sp. Cnat2-8]|uniref:hypothetical protein n=1 Tax=Alteromonas sp. Cnat2-8 TaxID=2917728 RepID=UPI001EF5DA03|nr:hypothetical protein [Alteromonas sp. Cnat2-8]MCG7655900.1 hypothetical protein [Alteromonas sp. Cnat2-8]